MMYFFDEGVYFVVIFDVWFQFDVVGDIYVLWQGGQYGVVDVFWIQVIGQQEWLVQVGWNVVLVEGYVGIVVVVWGMVVEQEVGGVGIVQLQGVGVDFFMVVYGDCFQVGYVEVVVEVFVFFFVELQQGWLYCVQYFVYFFFVVVVEQCYYVDYWCDCLVYCVCFGWGNLVVVFVGKDEVYCVYVQFIGQVDVVGLGYVIEFDVCVVVGVVYSVILVGRCQLLGYRGLRNIRFCGGVVGLVMV